MPPDLDAAARMAHDTLGDGFLTRKAEVLAEMLLTLVEQARAKDQRIAELTMFLDTALTKIELPGGATFEHNREWARHVRGKVLAASSAAATRQT